VDTFQLILTSDTESHGITFNYAKLQDRGTVNPYCQLASQKAKLSLGYMYLSQPYWRLVGRLSWHYYSIQSR